MTFAVINVEEDNKIVSERIFDTFNIDKADFARLNFGHQLMQLSEIIRAVVPSDALSGAVTAFNQDLAKHVETFQEIGKLNKNEKPKSKLTKAVDLTFSDAGKKAYEKEQGIKESKTNIEYVGEIIKSTFSKTPQAVKPDTIKSEGYKIKSLLTPEISPNSTIILTSAVVNEVDTHLVVDTVRHYGSNFSNDFYSESKCFYKDGVTNG